MIGDRLKGWMFGGVMACVLPLSVQAQDIQEELRHWQQDMSEAVLKSGARAAEQMLTDTRRRLKFQLAQEAREILLFQEARFWQYARQSVPGPRSAERVDHGDSLVGDIP